jgi:DNA-binding CsgD family transcriptional regulator
MKRELARRVRHELARLSMAGLDAAALTQEVERQVRAVVPFDRACWHNVDPQTAVVTNVLGEAPIDDPRLGIIEYADDDVNKYVTLARAPRSAATLRHATDDRPRFSRRYREVLEPMGLDDELTASFVDNAMLWGCARLYRARGKPAFDREEVAFMAGLSPVLAGLYRRALLAPSGSAAVPARADGAAVLILDAHDRVEAITDGAQGWLDEMLDIPRDAARPLPHAIHALAARTRARDDVAPGSPVRSRLRSRTGGWLALEGSRFADGAAGRVVIVVGPARPAETAPLVLEAYGLTDREREVVLHVLRGLANKEIATALGVSAYTVADHLKAIFERVGVGSRGELVAHVFFDALAPAWPA